MTFDVEVLGCSFIVSFLRGAGITSSSHRPRGPSVVWSASLSRPPASAGSPGAKESKNQLSNSDYNLHYIKNQQKRYILNIQLTQLTFHNSFLHSEKPIFY